MLRELEKAALRREQEERELKSARALLSEALLFLHAAGCRECDDEDRGELMAKIEAHGEAFGVDLSPGAGFDVVAALLGKAQPKAERASFDWVGDELQVERGVAMSEDGSMIMSSVSFGDLVGLVRSPDGPRLVINEHAIRDACARGKIVLIKDGE